MKVCGILLVLSLVSSVLHAEITSEGLAAIRAAFERNTAGGNAPGFVFIAEHQGAEQSLVLGDAAVVHTRRPMERGLRFDAASLTKVVATTPCVMHVVETGKLSLSAPIKTYLPEFTGEGRDAVTLRHLLTHTSGLPPGIPREPEWSGYQAGVDRAVAMIPEPGVDRVFRYSDVNFILLGEIVQRVSGQSLDACAKAWIYELLGMSGTGFVPNDRAVCVPTERDAEGQMLQGVVHDPTSRRMGGVTGHAGLFTTADDLARYARMLLNGGELGGRRLFSQETVKLMTSVQTPESVGDRRGLGWDIDTRYSRPRGRLFPLGGYGHTGWTGTALWIDPLSRSFWLMLSSRLHPDGVGDVRELQEEVGTLVAQGIKGFDFTKVAAALPRRAIVNGVDVAKREGLPQLKGMRVGLITNQTGIDRQRRSTIDVLRGMGGFELVALFSPEHGIRGQLDQEKISDTRDAETGLPIYSLYGEHRVPTAAQLAKMDALVFDIQDIGCRFYTYISTLKGCMEAAAKANKTFVVLDRVNPINGMQVEGPSVVAEKDFTACHDIPLRHGMTVGELAQMFKAELKLDLKLHVIPCDGWRRGDWWDGTALPWQNPSPNMRSLTAATLYPGIGLLEFAISVGRGTDSPFEILGAPYVKADSLARELSALQLPGIRFSPAHFKPKSSVFKDQPCGGVKLLITDRAVLRPTSVGFAIGHTLHRLYGEKFDLKQFNRLMQDAKAISDLREEKPWNLTTQRWQRGVDDFLTRRKPFLLYRD